MPDPSPTSRRSRDSTARFHQRYTTPASEAHLIVEREAIGANVGANGYTTLKQADRLARQLRLAPGALLLDIGSGRGWPAVYLAQTTGCTAFLSDPQQPALAGALGRARDLGISDSVHAVRCGAADLPFAARSFDAISHTDTL